VSARYLLVCSIWNLYGKVSITALEAWKGQMLGVEACLLIVTQPWDVTPNYALTAWHACCEIVLYNRSNLINPRKSTGPRALRSHSSNGYRDVKFYTPRRGDYKSRTYPNAARFCESWVDTGDSTGDAVCM
jgi:hypothetical protein